MKSAGKGWGKGGLLTQYPGRFLAGETSKPGFEDECTIRGTEAELQLLIRGKGDPPGP